MIINKLIIFCSIMFSFVVGDTLAFPQTTPEPVTAELSFTQKYTPDFLQDIMRYLQEVQAKVNRYIPKYMKMLKESDSLWATAVPLLAALAYGIFHTLGPGHGKMIVATYFLTREAQYLKGIWVGVLFSLAHVGGAIVLVLVADISLRTMLFSPEEKLFWVKIVSYGGVLVVGTYLLQNAARHMWALAKEAKKPKIVHVNSGFAPLGQDTSVSHQFACAHCKRQEELAARGEANVLSIFAGAVPCTGSLLILLYAMAHDILFLGVLMVLMVGAGMALTMISIGFIAIFTQKSYSQNLGHSHTRRHFIKVFIECIGALFLTLLAVLLLMTVFM